ncbi:hypothetical protein MPH48_03495 [Lysinibacillus fusiformis]|uniref:hypothetical protein n=1 Tax=Lysinibacillus fusiformis TaxID=28031 RepID=UPI001F4EA561|nr:hypothetical protein [Lysinibacillus fusiformis]MCK1987163.1 hypothetical protein [Lysinibacillus fusiformis]
MTLPELTQKLEALGYPVAYSHFKSAQEPPFICYLVVDGDTFSADNTVLSKSTYVDIELYVVNKDLAAEKKIEDMLKENELPWSYDEIFIKDEGVFKCTYSITLIN